MKIMLNETICLFDYSGFEQNKQTNKYIQFKEHESQIVFSVLLITNVAPRSDRKVNSSWQFPSNGINI